MLLDENCILFIQCKGEVCFYDLLIKKFIIIVIILVSIKYYDKDGNFKDDFVEDGLMGLNKDFNFVENGWVYMYYLLVEGDKNVFFCFEMKGDEFLMELEVVMLEVFVQWEECCYMGGFIVWDVDGNFYFFIGDNINLYVLNGYSLSDECLG